MSFYASAALSFVTEHFVKLSADRNFSKELGRFEKSSYIWQELGRFEKSSYIWHRKLLRSHRSLGTNFRLLLNLLALLVWQGLKMSCLTNFQTAI
jgi:hypothetical protein